MSMYGRGNVYNPGNVYDPRMNVYDPRNSYPGMAEDGPYKEDEEDYREPMTERQYREMNRPMYGQRRYPRYANDGEEYYEPEPEPGIGLVPLQEEGEEDDEEEEENTGRRMRNAPMRTYPRERGPRYGESLYSPTLVDANTPQENSPYMNSGNRNMPREYAYGRNTHRSPKTGEFTHGKAREERFPPNIYGGVTWKTGGYAPGPTAAGRDVHGHKHGPKYDTASCNCHGALPHHHYIQ